MSPAHAPKPNIVVVGNGMVGHHFIEETIRHNIHESHTISIFADEPRLAYDRVHLSEFFAGKSADALSLVAPGQYEGARISVTLGDAISDIDLGQRRVHTVSGKAQSYDWLVLATGSRPYVPEVEGRDAKGCFVYRTIDDLVAIREYAAGRKTGVVIGGGLLGLEAAGALRALELKPHVVEFASRLMPLQVDEMGGNLLRARIEELGVSIHLDKSTTAILSDASGSVCGLRFADGGELETDLVVFSAGIRARDELAERAGLVRGPRGGVQIDERCLTSDPHVFAVGECALWGGKTFGLVAPGYRMAEVAAATIAGREAKFAGFDMSTKLKLLGVDVGSFGDAFARTEGSRVVLLVDGTSNTYKKLVLSQDKQRILGGILVGDTTAYSELLTYAQNAIMAPEHPESLLVAAKAGGRSGLGVESLPDSATICSCHNVTKGGICAGISQANLTTLSGVKSHTKAGTGCGSCATLLDDLLKFELRRAGVAVTNYLCEHFAYSRQELFHLVEVQGIRDFQTLIQQHGHGDGCEVCKPAVASILASIHNEHILSRPHLGLQDTNDRYLANIQRDGTYSVVPRIAAGEVTPQQLLAIGNVAKEFGLYTKITGGQRIDMFGARLEQLPLIWRQLVNAGFESGHAYGKALRTVKSCVGSTWCRFGVQDSVGLAITIENRYKGLRGPHKIKGAVSGCARECAEAQGKDFGVIATEKGYNLYVCGNGGMKPQHAQLLVTDVDAEQLVRYLDRFLMFYIRTADRLQRTATWLNKLDGGMEYLRAVIVEDSLGIAETLEAEMANTLSRYQCEWKETLNDPEKLKRFRAFVNSDSADPSVVVVEERGQIRPATWGEKAELQSVRHRRLPLVERAT